MSRELSVVIPAYNEEGEISKTLRETAEYLTSRQYRHEILVLNDGSTDSTPVKIKEVMKAYPQIVLVDRKINKGKGQTVKEGIELVKYSFCLFMDADNSTSIVEWDKFEKLKDAGHTAMAASRHLPDSTIGHSQPWSRRFLGTGYRFLCRLFFGLKVTDFNCGFKAFDTALAKRLFSQVTMMDWTFDVELFCLMKKMGVCFVEVPVRWTHVQKSSSSSIFGPVRSAVQSFRSLLKLKTRY